MIDHLELNVSDIQRSTAFYTGALAPLGYALHVPSPLAGFGSSPSRLDFWLRGGGVCTPRPHFAFHCEDRALVARAYEAALRAGGEDAGAPISMPHIHAHYYAAFVRDPDGHKVEFACHAPG